MATTILQTPFATAAERAQRRIALASLCRILTMSAWWVFGPAVIGVVVYRATGHHGHETLLASLLAIGWFATVALVAWQNRPTAFSALASWDRAAGRKEEFASAYAFEESADKITLGEQLHVSRARDGLRSATAELARNLPVKIGAHAWVPPLLLIVFTLTGIFRQPVPKEEQALSADARNRASQTAKELARKAALTDPFKGLTKEERAKAEELKAQLEQTAKKLERLRQETPRDVLAELEKRAHEAEKLAANLAGDDLSGLSTDLISELERNADTAEFGNALRENSLDKASEEAKKLGARLGRKDLSLEERKRIEEALKRAMSAAKNKDKESSLGRQLGKALSHMQANQLGQAGQQFSNLAQQLATAGQRQKAQNQLRQLAGSLRSAGQQILGGQLGALQRLPQQQLPPGMKSLGSLPLQMGPLSLNPYNTGKPTAAIPFGMPGNMPPGASGQPPIPGMVPGTSGNPPTAMFPMPGGNNPPAGVVPGMGAGAGAFPMPGGGASAAGGGGSQAGNGSAGYQPFIVAPLPAAKTGVVNAQPGAVGPSETRAVEGQQHGEASARSAQEIATEFLKVEERSLSEEPLPLSRREQVLRYFTALRKRLDQPAAAGLPPPPASTP